MNRRTALAVAATVALTTSAGLTASHLGSAAAASGATEHFRIYSGNLRDHDLREVFSGRGPVHGVGTAKPNDDAPGDSIPVVITMRGGGKVFLTAHGPFTWHPDLRTCTATEHDTGTYKITGGTGRYRGATGSGTYTERGAGIGRRNAQGVCQQSFAINYVVVDARGAIHL